MGKYILTGGPGVGKTTLLSGLGKLGYMIIPEVPRQIIEEEQEKERSIQGYKGLFPWTNLEKFQDPVIERQILLESKLKNVTDPIFLDRSLVDTIAYCELEKVKIRPDIYKLIRDSDYRTVFFLEQLRFYVTDMQRLEDELKAKKLHEKLHEIYESFCFNIISIPDLPIEKRLEFVLKEVNK